MKINTINKDHFTINRTHIATITIDENSKYARLEYYPFVKLNDLPTIYFQDLLAELQELIACIDSDKDNDDLYERLERSLINAERYFQNEDSLSRIQSLMYYCTNAILKEEYDGVKYDITSYSSTFEGKERIANNEQE